jgi:hypothetical protein
MRRFFRSSSLDWFGVRVKYKGWCLWFVPCGRVLSSPVKHTVMEDIAKKCQQEVWTHKICSNSVWPETWYTSWGWQRSIKIGLWVQNHDISNLSGKMPDRDWSRHDNTLTSKYSTPYYLFPYLTEICQGWKARTHISVRRDEENKDSTNGSTNNTGIYRGNHQLLTTQVRSTSQNYIHKRPDHFWHYKTGALSLSAPYLQ